MQSERQRLEDPCRLLRANQVAELLGLHTISVFKWSRQGRLPKPIRLGQGFTAWRAADLVKFLDRLQDQPEPEKPHRGRPKKELAAGGGRS